MVAASLFAGATVWPLIQRARAKPAAKGEGEIALALEHAAVDVRLGRGASVVESLGALVPRVKQATLRARLLDLQAEAAIQAGRLDVAEIAVEEREKLTTDPATRRTLELRRIGLYGALGNKAKAEDLAESIVKNAENPAIADEARWRMLAATKTAAQIKDWLKTVKPEETETERRLGWAALRMLNDPAEAERMLAAVEKAGQKDASLERGLLEAYTALGRPKDIARVAAELESLIGEPTPKNERERAQLELVRVRALAQAGDADQGLQLIDAFLGRARDFDLRQAARRMRFELLATAGRLKAEISTLEKKGDRATRAYVALEIERDYGLAERLYGELGRTDPDSMVFAQGLQQARERKDLAERKALYEQVLAKDPEDKSAREKLLAAAIALGDLESARRIVGESIKGKEKDAQALLTLAQLLERVGLAEDAAATLERAHAAETDAGKKQQILMALGDLYTQGRQEENARRLFSDLAARGVTPEIREQAVARLAALLRL